MTTPHTAVNGGLIDFQDNYGRTMCEYPTPQQIMAAAAAGYPPQGMYMPGMAQPASLAGYPGSQPSFHLSNPGVYPAPMNQSAMPNPAQALGQPQIAAPAPTAAGSTTVAPAHGTYISGPPMFLHAYGKTYKPVEDAVGEAGVASGAAGGGQGSSKARTSAADLDGDTATTKMLTESDLHQAIDQRVQSKVESYLSTRRQPASPLVAGKNPAVGSRSGSTIHSARNFYSTRPSSGMTAEERAAMRVQSVNATMRGASAGSGRPHVRECSHLSRDW